MTASEEIYFTDPEGDLLIRSRDQVEIRVLKAILARSSPFFHSMLSIPQPNPNKESQKEEAVVIDESSDILSLLLRFIYPIAHPTIQDLADLFPVLEVAEKYEVTGVIVTLRRIMMMDKFLHQDPVRIYALACRYGYEEEGVLAAIATLQLGLLNTETLEGPEYDHFTARDYNRLITWHRLHANHAMECINHWRLTSASACIMCQKWGCGWWEPYKIKAIEELTMRPCSQRVFTTDFMVDVLNGGSCDSRWINAFSSNTRLSLFAIRTKIRDGSGGELFQWQRRPEMEHN